MECLFTNGIDLRTRRPLWEKVPFDEFLRAFRDRLPSAREDFARRLLTTQGLSTAYNIFKAATSPNLNDPLQVEYGVICARDPSLEVEWGERMQPFRMFVSRLLQGSTVGYAMEQFGFLYNELGNDLARRIDRFVRWGWTPRNSTRSCARW